MDTLLAPSSSDTQMRVENGLVDIDPLPPTVICGNKLDLKPSKSIIRPHQITYPAKRNLPYVEMSVKYQYNLIKPFLYLARQLLKDENLLFLAPPSSLLLTGPSLPLRTYCWRDSGEATIDQGKVRYDVDGLERDEADNPIITAKLPTVIIPTPENSYMEDVSETFCKLISEHFNL